MRAAITRLRNRGEGGFTLVELLVAITIQGLIMGALAMAFVGIMRGGTQVNQSLSKTGDARIAAQYIVSDARNSSGPEISLSDTSSCPDPSPPVAGTASPVVRFNWDSTDSDGDTVANTVNYVKVGSSLLRRQCVGGVLMSGRAVASNVQSVDVGCVPDDDCSGTPTSIVITVTSTPDASGTSYSYTLSTTFRKLIADGPPSNPKSVILLGSGGTCTPLASGSTNGIGLTGSGTMRVYGDALINTTDASSSCTAMLLANSGVWKAGGTKFLNGGSCRSWTNGLNCPTSSTYSPALADPWAAKITAGTMTAPSASGASLSGCSGPGYYPNGFTLGGGSSCTLASGVYVVKNGFSISNGATVTTASGGVLIYLLSGAFSVGGGASVTLTAQTSGQYAGLAVWQDKTNTSTISWSNGGALVFNGAIYGPKAQLNVSGNAQTPIVTSLVVQSIILTNSGGITVGSPSTTPLSITSTALDNWTVNRSGYSYTVGVDGGDGLYSFSATGLPAGLSIDTETGEISGTPTVTGTSTVGVTLSDQLGDDPVTKNLSITVNAAPSISTTSPLTNGEVGASYTKTVAGSGGTTPYSWSATGLPAGLSISSGGVISGTPTLTGTSTVNLTLTDAAGATATKNVSLQVVSAVGITTASPLTAATYGVAYNTTVAASGGATAYSWSATGLPAGLSISSSTGAITGTPTGSGIASVIVTVTDSLGGTANKPLSLTVKPAISSVTLVNKSGGTQGTIEAGDSIKIVFSTAMKVSSICSGWSNDASDQSITAANNVTASVNNVSGSDTITFASTTCPTLNLGTLSLGSTAYVTATRTFKGSSPNASTITWTVSTRTLVITLGTASGATVNVASSTPSWTPGAITDPAPTALGNSPFTLPAGKQF